MPVPSASSDNPPSTDSLYELVEQLTERLHRGEIVDLSEVVAAHPHHAERLQQVLPALEVLADVHGGSSIAARVAAGSARSSADELSGMLGDFQLIREIGRGGMGVVYEARQISLDRRVALKVLPFAGVLDARQLQRFTNEARAAAGLHHANIVPVYAVGCERGVHYYAMQYIDGQTLADVIHEMRSKLFPPLGRGGQGGSRSMLEDGTDSKRIGPAGGFKVGDDLTFSAVEHAEELTNDENQVSKEIRNSRVKRDSAEMRNAPPATADKQCGINVQRTGGLTARRSPSSPNSSTLRCIDSSTPSRERFRTIAEWGIRIAEALDYAHSVGVIHRDIKPANLMLDSLGRVWITDFGLARIETDAGLTMTGDIVGTLGYMSPEQALGERGLVDQRTDVYSLGLALYELLTLKPAFGDANRRELLQRIAVDDPIPARRMDTTIPVELETIVQKATEKEAAARYSTARDLADDLRRFLHEQPIKARPATALDRLRKCSKRNRVLVRTCTAFVGVAVVASTAAFLVLDHQRQEILLEQQARAAEQKQSAAARAIQRHHQYVTQINLAERARQAGLYREARRQLYQCLPLGRDEDLRSFEWYYLWQATRGASPTFGNHQGEAYCAAISPDRRVLATGGKDGVRLWNCESGEPIGHLTGHSFDVNGVSFSPDGKLLASASDDRSVKIWSTSDWQVVRTIPHAGKVIAAVFSPNRPLLATCELHEVNSEGRDAGPGFATVWDMRTWEPLAILREHTGSMQSLAISDDGSLLATGNSDGTACLWELETFNLRHRFVHRSSQDFKSSVACVAFAHCHPYLAACGSGGIGHLWHTGDGSLVSQISDKTGEVQSVSFSPDDARIAVANISGDLVVWRRGPGDSYVFDSQVHVSTVSRLWSVTFLEATTTFTAGSDGVVQRRQPMADTAWHKLPSSAAGPSDFAFSPTGEWLAVAAGTLDLYSLSGNWERTRLAPPESATKAVAVSPDGTTIATGEADGHVTLRGLGNEGWTRRDRFANQPVHHLAFAGLGQPLTIQYTESESKFYCNPISREPTSSPIPDAGPLDSFKFDVTGRRGVILRQSGRLEAWSDNVRLWQIEPGGPAWSEFTFSADGQRLAASRKDSSISIWNLRQPEMEFKFVAEISHPALSVDGRTLAGAADQKIVTLWNVATGRELLKLEVAELAGIHKLEFSPAGQCLAVLGHAAQAGGAPIQVLLVLSDPDQPDR